MWAPPLNRAVTADDFLYAFQRINDKKLVAQYGNYYCGVIKGMDCAAKDDNQPISGIKVTDPTHISFTLDQPTGDLLYRLSMPATKAVPVEVRGCFPNPGDYGVDLISSGPYMILGQDKLNLSSCSTIKPISGYNVDKGMTMVRNPNWSAATDDTRAAYADGVQIKINSNVDDSFNALENGDLDVVQGTPPVAVLQDFETNPDFVFTVTRDFVRACHTPVLILPDDIPAHPYAVAMEAAMLAPNAEVSMFPWKEPKERIPLAVRQIRSFLRAHRPASQ